MHPIVNVVAPLILLAVLLIFTVIEWRRRNPRTDAISEEGAKKLREQLNEEDQQNESGSR